MTYPVLDQVQASNTSIKQVLNIKIKVSNM